jgi:hypothetical protein
LCASSARSTRCAGGSSRADPVPADLRLTRLAGDARIVAGDTDDTRGARCTRVERPFNRSRRGRLRCCISSGRASSQH